MPGVTPVVVLHAGDAFYAWSGGRYVDVYANPQEWAAGNTPLRTFEVEPTPFEPTALETLVTKHLVLRAAKAQAARLM